MEYQVLVGIQILSALLAPIVALAVAAIAYLQWRTNRQKLILDLYDRRRKIYDQAFEIIRPVNISAKSRPSDSASKMKLLAIDSRFFFGEEVSGYLDRIASYLIDMEVAEGNDEGTGHYSNMRTERRQDVAKFHEEFSKLCRDYMTLDQKRPWM